MSSAQLLLAAAVLVTSIAAWTDLRTGLIPNRLTLTTLASGIFAAFVFGGLRGGAHAVTGAVAAALVPALLYRAGALGGGDLKLFAACGALLGLSPGIELQLYSFVLAALVLPARLAWDGKLFATLGNAARLAASFFLPPRLRAKPSAEVMTPVRFGPAIFAGAVMVAFTRWGNP